ncbi:hypothetical protein ACSO1_20190 [Acinetobacter calcoaceticus]|nr:hypothetical protein ACSO1_20190 [Acinetobacter calcoaceticus]
MPIDQAPTLMYSDGEIKPNNVVRFRNILQESNSAYNLKFSTLIKRIANHSKGHILKIRRIKKEI